MRAFTHRRVALAPEGKRLVDRRYVPRLPSGQGGVGQVGVGGYPGLTVSDTILTADPVLDHTDPFLEAAARSRGEHRRLDRELRRGSLGRAFMIGPRGYHARARQDMMPGTDLERFLVAGHEVVVAEAHDKQGSVATLIGTHHELMTVFSGPRPERRRVADLFGSFVIKDDPAGMTVSPRPDTLLDTLSEAVTVVVAGRGVIDMPNVTLPSVTAPRHAGASTRHGEIWRSVLPDTDAATPLERFTFTVAFDRGLAHVHFLDSATTADELLGWLDDINVTWAG